MRHEFPKKVKLAAWERSGGRCEICGGKIRPGNGPEYHHQYKPATEPGSNSLDNCQVLCMKPCHSFVSATETIPQQAKDNRVFEKRIGARKTKRPFPKRVDPWNKGRDA